MTVEHALRRAFTEKAQELQPGAPDIEALMTLGERARRRRATVVLRAASVLIVLGLGAGAVVLAGVDRQPVRGAPPHTGVRPWSPEVLLLSLDASSDSGGQQRRGLDGKVPFTVVESGVVYVDPQTSRVVWQGWQQERRVLGDRPWRPDHDLAAGPGMRRFLRSREVVGDPLRDLVTWVEADGAGPGDVVVVQPSTGVELARTPFEPPLDTPVMVASVDDRSVYLATPSGRLDTGLRGHDLWVWDWATGEAPRSRPSDEYVMDVNQGVWAVGRGTGLRFEDTSGMLLSEVPSLYGERVFFGTGLSPDGAYWFGPVPDAELVVVATGERRQLHLPPLPGGTATWVWVAPTKLAAIGWSGGRYTVCDATTGTCEEELPVPHPAGCGFDDLSCGLDLPSH